MGPNGDLRLSPSKADLGMVVDGFGPSSDFVGEV